MTEKDQRPTWLKAIGTFLLPIALFMVFRWIIFEPYVIPSGSMIPSLLKNDNILVAKWSYGIRVPFSKRWLMEWREPQRGEIAVFIYPLSRDVFYVKRIFAIGGDVVEGRDGQIYLNGEVVAHEPIEDYQGAEPGFEYHKQVLDDREFVFQSDLDSFRDTDFGPVEVPMGHFFVIGDNRDHSADSRLWGSVPNENLMGIPYWIWLSCNETLPQSAFVCDPNTLRTERIGKSIQ